MPRFKSSIPQAVLAICAALPLVSVHAQMAVIDGANLVEAVQKVQRFQEAPAPATTPAYPKPAVRPSLPGFIN